MTPEIDAQEEQPAVPLSPPETAPKLPHSTPREAFEIAMKRLFPTFAGVVSLGAETSAAMKAERQAMRTQAIADRATKQKR